MVSLQEAMQPDFAGGGSLEDLDLAAFGFGWLEEFGSVNVDGSCSTVSAAETCIAPAASADALMASEEEEERRLRRRISNRESAKRSRARKRRLSEELEGALEALRAENRALAARLDAASRRALAVRLGSARLHAEAGALRHRLGEAQRSAVVMLGINVPAADAGSHCTARGLTTAPRVAVAVHPRCAASAAERRGAADKVARRDGNKLLTR